MKLSAIVLTHNNKSTIKACLAALNFAAEIIVVDDNSSDGTQRIAKETKARIYTRSLNADFASQRNFALTKAKGDWALFVDSDEIVSSELQNEIKTAISAKNVSGYYLKRRDYFLGTILNHGETGNISLLRLAKKNAGKWKRSVHEVWAIKGQTKTLKHPLLHKRSFTISQFIDRLNTYTALDSQALIREGKHFSYFDLFFKPPGKFLYNYFFLLGFLDGLAGFVMAFLMSFHSLVVRIKLWENKYV